MAVLHPGGLTIQERQNLEDVRFEPPVVPIFIEFTVSDLNKSRSIIRIPKNSLIIAPVFVRVTNVFNSTSPVMLLGLNTDRDVGVAFIGNTGVVNFVPDVSDKSQFLTKIEKDSTLKVTVFEFGQTNPSRGKGWVLLQYVNLNLLGA